MFRFRNKIISLLVVVGVLTAAGFVFAQPNLGLNEFGAQTNLGTQSLGQIIAGIVRVFLSVLGIIAVILTLYAGFLWMTANGDATKIATAKKLLINAVIGLAIILASLAVTQFILGALSSATGTNIEAIGGGGGGGGGLPSDAFVIKGISPQGSISIRNVVVRVAVNHAPDTATINGNVLIIKKSDNSLAPYTFTVSNNTIELTSTIACPAPNATAKCFDADTAYKVEVKTGLKDTGGKNLNCGGFAPNCTAEFTTGSLVDTQPPQVAVTYPDPGQAVPENSPVAVWAKATDDSAVAQIDFFADSAYFDKAVPQGASPAIFDGKVFWDTTGAARGTHNLSAKAYDIDSNNTISAPLSVKVLAAHCFNSVKDADETGLDCGGADCAVCSGGACTQNSDCTSNSCQNGLCVDTPIILGVSPADGAPGTYVTISGKYFGATPGTVTFLGATGSADDKVAGLAPCNGAWSDKQVVVVVPQGVTASGPIEIKNTIGSDTTNDPRGPVLPDFVVTATLRPGICSLSPAEGKSGTTFTISGTEFGASQGTSFIKFGQVYAAPQTWSNVAISALVPVLSAGDNSVQINRNGVDSNAVNFTVLSLNSGTKPAINYVDPGQGPAGEYITIFGNNFGEAAGVVQFLRADGTVALGDTSFPASCAAINYWHNSYVTVKVPVAFSDGTPTKNTATNLRVRRADAALSNSVAFSVNSNTPKPGICGLQPDNGPVGTPVNILGERFGSAGTVTFYNNVGASAVWGSEMIATAAPKGAVSGPVKIVVASQNSNSVNFSVSDCSKTPGICTVDEQCCAASCISKTAVCQAAPKEGAYAWHISTGIIPKVPHVVEDCSTGDKAANPSPSPWDSRPGGNSVCINAIVNIHFDSKLDPATVIMNGVAADTVALYKCTGGASSAPCATKTKVALSPIDPPYAVNATDDGIQLYPAGGNLEKNTQYLVELSAKIRGAGAGGGYMEEKTDCGAGLSYCFNFKTANSDGLCKVGSLTTSPQDYISDKKDLLEYISTPHAKDDVCLNINGLGYKYDWNSSQPSSAGIFSTGLNKAGQSRAYEALIQTISETTPLVPAVITSSIPAENVSGKTNLTVIFADPAIVEKWPSCTTACVNSEIGAEFNVDMDPATISPANITVFVCTTENCDDFSGTVTGKIVYTHEDVQKNIKPHFNFTPSQNLATNTFYQARLYAKNIKSASGVALTGANFGSYYIWQFRTKNDATPCAVNKVNVNPQSQVFNYIPQIAPFDSEALGAPDECNPQGQLLNPYSYNWSWNSLAPAIVSLKNNGAYNVLPPAGIGCNDKCLRTGSTPHASVCGNGGAPEKGESCDDGNTKNGDLCSDHCLNEGTAALTCGNGVKDKGEDCDLGADNGKTGSYCSSKCLLLGSAAGGSFCGNSTIGHGENCDDGNTASGDGCSSQCLNEGSLPNIASCGDGKVEKDKGEDCDLGADNGKSGSGCSSICLATGTLAPTCGNKIIEAGETCDDRNLVDGDGCSSQCLNEGSNLNYGSVCGNGGAPEKGESCDSGTSDTNIDPRQYGQAEKAGKTKINAATQNVTGSSDVEVQCVSTSDAECQQYPHQPDESLGVGVDNCCYVRPQVVLTIPSSNQTDVCRNTLISATFNKIMDGAAGQISIDQKKNGTDCSLLGAKEVKDDFGVVWCAGAIKATRTVYEDAKNKQTEFDWNIDSLLEAGKTYRVVLNNFKNKSGVLQSVNPYPWTFTADDKVCKIDQVKINPNPMIFSNVKAVTADNSNGSPQQAQAQAISLPDNRISSVAGIYAWDWKWKTSPNKFISLSATADMDKENISALGNNGEETLSAAASFTADRFNLNAGAGDISGAARVIVFICEKPWPGLQTFPYTVDTTANASTYYCRDNKPNLLPDLKTVTVPSVPGGDILKEYLFTDPATGDAIGMRIYQNPNHLSPLAWYKSKQFVGTPTASQVDGYNAIVDGRSTYINAANTYGGDNYTNIFVISYSQTAAPEMQNVYNQILKNWTFNTNLQNIELCRGTSTACTNDLDCVNQSVCQSDKDKIRRDTKRLEDFNSIAAAFDVYKQKNATYPQLLSGSFLRGRSVSVWPSWQAALGNDLGTALPADPVNKHATCPARYDSTTCWNGATGYYVCPAGSHIYNYWNLTQDSYQFGSDFEYNFGVGWNNINSNFYIAGICNGTAMGTSAKCGDGVVGGSEQCEKGVTGTESCTMPDGRTGKRLLSCNPPGTASQCQWNNSAGCQAGQCNDGVKQATEICDDGQNNGRYGYCNTSCTGLSTWCGDGQINGPEQCDLGTNKPAGQNNGDYGSGCSWDCKLPGPVCGDNIIQAGKERCDGNSETKNIDANGIACPNVIINGVSYPTQNVLPCIPAGQANQCQSGTWTGCLPMGVCGNGAKEGTEQCDSGAKGKTSDACVMDTAKLPTPYACKTAVCGDGYLWANHESCDNGNKNSNGNDGNQCTAGYNLTCNYCSTSCNIVTKTGPYCGDAIKNGPEECDGQSFGALTCNDFGFMEFSGQNHLQCVQSCKANTSNCISVIRINAGGPEAPDSWTDPATGNVWISDTIFDGTPNQLYVSGGQWPGARGQAIGNTEIDKIYQSQRYPTGSDLRYNFNIGNGAYKVRLHFAETFTKAVRKFNIDIDGIRRKSDFDVRATAGGNNIATVQEFNTIVQNGVLNITLSNIAAYSCDGLCGAFINGIEIESSNTAGGQYETPPPPSGSGTPAVAQKTCPPKTCADLGAVCGNPSDGCGGTLSCPTCDELYGTSIPGYCTPTYQCKAYKIDAGNTSRSGPGLGWSTDGGFSVCSGSTCMWATTDPITNVPAGVPMEVYQSEHYDISQLTSTFYVPMGKNYTVRLHFAENLNAANCTGCRIFNINVNGTALNNFDIFAAAGGFNRAVYKDFSVTNVGSGGIKITLTKVGNSANGPKINGIEIIPL